MLTGRIVPARPGSSLLLIMSPQSFSKMLLLVFLLTSTILRVQGAVAAVDSYEMSHLLKPQLRFEINLVIPDNMWVSPSFLPPSLLQSIKYLVGKQVPFRLHYNSNQTRRPYISSRSYRYAENQVSHLVFVVLQSAEQELDLLDILLSCCTTENDFVAWGTIVNGHIQFIADESALDGIWGGWYRLNIHPRYLPLNFVILYWCGSTFGFSHADLVRETCQCDDGPSLLTLMDFFTVINHPNGIKRLAPRIRREKTDFRGRRLIICPYRQVSGSWESLWSHVLLPFSFRLSHRFLEGAVGGLLHAFVSKHNFTFDSMECDKDGEYWEQQGIINTVESVCSISGCVPPPVSLDAFAYKSTLSFAKPTQPRLDCQI